MKVIFLDTDGVLTHTDYLNWQTRHIDPEKVLEQIPSVIFLRPAGHPLQTWDRQAAEVEKWLIRNMTCSQFRPSFWNAGETKLG